MGATDERTLDVALRYLKSGDTGALKELLNDSKGAAAAIQEEAKASQTAAMAATEHAARVRSLTDNLKQLALQQKQNTPEFAALKKELEGLNLQMPKAGMSTGQMVQQLGLLTPATSGATSTVAGLVTTVGTLPVAGQIAALAIAAITAEAILLDGAVDTLTRGGKINGATQGFIQLSGGSAQAEVNIAKLRAASGGLISDFELMQRASLPIARGLSFDQLARLMETVRIQTEKTGRSFDEVFGIVLDAVMLKSVLRMDQFGFSMDQAEVSLMTVGEVADAAADQFELLNDKMGGAGETGHDAGKKVEVAWKNVREEWDAAAAEALKEEGLVDALSTIAGFLVDTAEAMPRIVDGFQAWFSLTPPGWFLDSMRGEGLPGDMQRQLGLRPAKNVEEAQKRKAKIQSEINALGPEPGPEAGSAGGKWRTKKAELERQLTTESASGSAATGGSFNVSASPSRGTGGYGETMGGASMGSGEKYLLDGVWMSEDAYTAATGHGPGDEPSGNRTGAGGRASRYVPGEQEKLLAAYLGRSVPKSDAERRSLYTAARAGAAMGGTSLEGFISSIRDWNGGTLPGMGPSAPMSTSWGDVGLWASAHDAAGGGGFSNSRNARIAKMTGFGQRSTFGRSTFGPTSKSELQTMREQAHAAGGMPMSTWDDGSSKDASEAAMTEHAFNIAAAAAQDGARGAGSAAVQAGLSMVAAANPGLAIPLGIVSSFVPGLFAPHQRNTAQDDIPMRMTNTKDITDPLGAKIEAGFAIFGRGTRGGNMDSMESRLSRGVILRQGGGR